MMPRPRMLALLLVVTLPACQPIEDAYCNARLPASRIDIRTDAPHYLLSQKLSARVLGDAHAKDGERITYGLTTATPMTRAEVNLHVTRLPGAVCARPDIQVTIAYQPMQVDLATELERNSCAYQVVLDHEMKHVDAYRAHLATVAQTLQGELHAHIASVLPMRYRDVAAAEKSMQELQDVWLVPRADQLLAGVAADQSAVDSPAEYARVAGACPGDTLLSGASAPN